MNSVVSRIPHLVLLVSLSLLGAFVWAGCGSNGGENTDIVEHRTFSVAGWPTVPQEPTEEVLAYLTNEEITNASDCSYTISAQLRELEADCTDGGGITLKVGGSAKRSATCIGNKSEGFTCYASLENLRVNGFSWSVKKAEERMLAAVEQVAEMEEGEEPGLESEEEYASGEGVAEGIASDSEGDEVFVKIYSGTPKPMKSYMGSWVKVCGEQVEGFSSPERTMAVSFDVWVRPLTSPTPDIEVQLGESGLLESEGDVNTEESMPLWAANYSEGPECGAAFETGLVNWGADAIQVGEEQGWEGYLLQPEAITPSSNAEEVGDRLVIAPYVQLAGRPAAVNWNQRRSTNLVDCFLPESFGDPETVVAVDPNLALAQGCTG